MLLTIVLSVLALLYGYTGWRLIPALRLAGPWSAVAWVAVALLFTLPIASMLLRHAGALAGLSKTVTWVGYVGLGFFCLAFFLCLARDLGLLCWRVLAAWQHQAGTAVTPTDLARREFLVSLSGAGVLLLSAACTGYGWYAARHRLRTFRVDVPLAGLPPAFDGFRIVQITDLHAGMTIGHDLVARVAAAANALGPDLIAVTGDLVDGDVADLRPVVAPLAQLGAPHGVFFCPGNHEYYNGNPGAWFDEFRGMGFEVLLNEHRIIERGGARLVVGGVTDHSAGEMIPGQASSPAAAFAGAPAGLIRLLLAHQPRSIEAAAQVGCDLQLSGHTHGGQFVPWAFFVPLQQPYLSGLHRHGDSWIYVSRGVGYWGPPLRLGVPAEVTLITLHTAPA